MGSINPVVVDLSSDEEPDPRVDDFNWFAEVLEAVHGMSDRLDEVEVVSEVKGESKTMHRKSGSLIPTVEDEDDDDDCVVLDGDPDKTTAAAMTMTAVDDDDYAAESDEVLVLGQKGEIACRDFPHPRHSCAKYPFNSTSPEKYCDMCHCYVCDIRAPCPYWCVGVSSIDHCHANDKEDVWKSQREYFRTGKIPSRPVLKPHRPRTRAPSTMPGLHSRTPASSIIRLSPNSLPRNQVGIRACSSSTRITGFPNVKTSCRIRQSRTALQNRSLQHRSAPISNGVRNTVIQKDRRPYISNLRPRVASSSPISENPRASGGGFLSNVSSYAPSNDNSNKGNYCNTAQGLQYTHSRPLLAASDPWRDVSSTINLEMYTQLGNQPSSVTGYLSAVQAPQSHVDTRQSCQNMADSGRSQNRTNADLFAPAETPHAAAGSCPQTFRQLGANNKLLESKLLSEFEDWLMDNPTAAVCPMSEPVGQDEGTLTFDFETFLN